MLSSTAILISTPDLFQALNCSTTSIGMSTGHSSFMRIYRELVFIRMMKSFITELQYQKIVMDSEQVSKREVQNGLVVSAYLMNSFSLCHLPLRLKCRLSPYHLSKFH